MEDSSLDDFFAKKDKSKKKSKVKSVEKDEGTKSTTTKRDKKKDKPIKLSSQNSSTIKTQEKKPDDDEWNDFEEERAVDYSGLRIQNLQQKEAEEKDVEDDEEEWDENGDVKEKKDRKEVASGPWKKSSGQTGAPAPVAEEEKKPAPTPANTGKYIPPSQRAAMAAATRSTGLPGKRGKKELPNIRSDVDFPTLSSMSIQDQPSHQSNQSNPSQKSIQETTSHHRPGGGALALENKFAVLQD